MGWPGAVDRDAMLLWAPVVAVLALSQTDIGREQPWSGSDLALAGVGLMLAAPLAMRRSRPALVAVCLGVAAVAQSSLTGLSFATFLAILVASYALGRFADPLGLVAGLVALAVGIVVADWGYVSRRPAEAIVVVPAVYLLTSATVGRVVRRLVAQSAELRRLNAALERERDAAARLAVATERMRLARDVHDVVAHALTVAVVQAESCEEAIGEEPERARIAARQVQAACRRGLAELRAIVRVLRDVEAPAEEPGLAHLEALADVVAGATLEVEVRRSGALADVPEELGRQLFRVVQEALTNVVKHSAASCAVVEVRADGDAVTLCVSDPGPAREAVLPSGGHGLAGMAERLAVWAGSLRAGPDGGGFRVDVRVPLPDGAAP